MHSKKTRIQLAVAAVLWTAVLACAAWLAASHGRKEYAELTPVELLDGFTPTQVKSAILLDGGSMVITVSAKDGSYTLRLNQAFWDPAKSAERQIWLWSLGPPEANGVVEPGAELTGAIQRNLQRALDAGGLDASAARTARNMIILLGDHRCDVQW